MSERLPMVAPQYGDSISTTTVEEIKHRHRPGDTYISPNFGDGGWHTTPGCQQFVTEWQPLRDRILVKLIPHKLDYSKIITPEIAVHRGSQHGIILKVGPGRWIDGEFYPTTVNPGMEVVIGPHTDWESNDAGWGENFVICQEADIRVIVNRE